MPYVSDWAPVYDASVPDDQKIPCRKCPSTDLRYIEWESSCGGHEDRKYRCNECGHHWWIEGADA